MSNSTSAGGIVFNEEGKFILVRQSDKSWSMPKGRIKDGEDTLTAAKREIYEETGVNKLEFIKDLGSYQRLSSDKVNLRTIILFLFKTNQKKLSPRDSENPEAKWAAKEEVVKLLPHKEDKEFFLKAAESLF